MSKRSKSNLFARDRVNILKLHESKIDCEKIAEQTSIHIYSVKYTIDKFGTIENYLNTGDYQNYTFPDFKKAVENSKNWKEVSIYLGIRYPKDSLHRWKELAIDLDISIKHFKMPSPKRLNTKEEYIVYLTNLKTRGGGSTIIPSLVRLGIKEYKCEECGNDGTWNDKPITLQLDHISGDHYNNSIENIRILCPNCHSQTPTYCGRARNCDIKRTNGNKKCTCGENIEIRSTKCYSCSQKTQERAGWPSNEELAKLVWESPRTKLAIQLNVTDKAIANRCNVRNISQPPRGYWSKKCSKN
jgi:hypothetical protein